MTQDTYTVRRATRKIWHLYDGAAVFGVVSMTSRGTFRWLLSSWEPSVFGVYHNEVATTLDMALDAAKRAYARDLEAAKV